MDPLKPGDPVQFKSSRAAQIANLEGETGEIKLLRRAQNGEYDVVEVALDTGALVTWPLEGVERFDAD